MVSGSRSCRRVPRDLFLYNGSCHYKEQSRDNQANLLFAKEKGQQHIVGREAGIEKQQSAHYGFFRTGHTKPLADYVAEELNADLYEIEAKIPYTDDGIKYYTDCCADREQNEPSTSPEIEGDLPDVSGNNMVMLKTKCV